MQPTYTRRAFFHMGALALATAGCARLGGTVRRIPSPNSDIRIAVVGIRSKGWAHVDQLRTIPGARLVALCDVDRTILAQRVDELAKEGLTVAAFEDYRKLLEQPDIDGVVLATPNHQHTLQTIWGCQAGVDVYVEKPVSHNLYESRVLQQVAARYGRIVQAGTQGRSNTGLLPAMSFIHEGGLGKLRIAKGFCYRERTSIGKTTGPQPIPEDINYDLWCGPAPMEPLRRKSLHYDWHWFWSTGCGEIGNQGVHELDMCRWAIQAPVLPPRVFSFGGRFGYDDDAETPNTQIAWFDYPNVPIVFEVRGLPRAVGSEAMDAYRSIRVGIVVEGENGYYAGGLSGGRFCDWNHKVVKRFEGDGGAQHLPNFIKALRSRNPGDVKAPVAECGTSSSLCHLANIAYRMGQPGVPDEIRAALPVRAEAGEAMDRFRDHLAQNQIDLQRTPITAGGWLEWDHANYRFSGGPHVDRANALISRDYRKGYRVKL